MPFKQEPFGVTFEDEITEYITQATHGCPYFMLTWGNCLAHELSQTGERVITMDTVKPAESLLTGEISKLYKERYQELVESALLPVAVVMAEAFLKGTGPQSSSGHDKGWVTLF